MIDIEKIKKIVNEENIRTNEPMADHTTFRIGGPAELYIEPDHEQIVPLIAALREAGEPFTVIGNGSNLLVSDAGLKGAVISIGKPMSKITLEGERITAEAGALLSKTAAEALSASLAGMEFASGIPGSVGGAVVMNAGAYGGEIKDILVSAEVLTKDGEVVTIPAEELDLSYRHSRIMDEGGIVLSAVFRLEPGDKASIKEKMDDLNGRRRDKQPLNFPSAGSTFKRPEGYFAGKLIMDAGLSGYQVGGAQVSEKHCGFVVNAGGATAADVCRLMQDVRAKVLEKDGVTLEPEVRLLGEFEGAEGLLPGKA